MTQPSEHNPDAISCHPALDGSENAQSAPNENVIFDPRLVFSAVHASSSIESGDITFVRDVPQGEQTRYS